MNRYQQAPHLTSYTNWKVTTSQIDITNESQCQIKAIPAFKVTRPYIKLNINFVSYFRKIYIILCILKGDEIGEMPFKMHKFIYT